MENFSFGQTEGISFWVVVSYCLCVIYFVWLLAKGHATLSHGKLPKIPMAGPFVLLGWIHAYIRDVKIHRFINRINTKTPQLEIAIPNSVSFVSRYLWQYSVSNLGLLSLLDIE